jgi:hypothetical protein
MPQDDELDPGASTMMFQAFVDREEPEPARSAGMRAAVAGAALVALLVAVAIGWLLLRG